MTREEGVYYLYLYANSVRLPDVAHQITVWETNEPAKDHLQDRLRIYTDLYHDHIPMLTETDVVEYSQEEDMIELGAAAEALLPTVDGDFAPKSMRFYGPSVVHLTPPNVQSK